eukprot:TRINITY_DN108534_c0_g1_i1.p1 TRINITY_DN108534_c0_g1~~TRINITY_DN108534_c0_g1_i1.p1  ORF type:complete len:448 (+),score=27.65 TRINITY_DN108534_c0_g1_i1:20-1363(+)
MSTTGRSTYSTASTKTERGRDYWAEKEAIRDANRARKFHARQARLQAKHLREWDTIDPETEKVAFHHSHENLHGNEYIFDPERPETVKTGGSQAGSTMPSLSPRPTSSVNSVGGASHSHPKFCNECGTRILSKTVRFCINCGNSLEGLSPQHLPPTNHHGAQMQPTASVSPRFNNNKHNHNNGASSPSSVSHSHPNPVNYNRLSSTNPTNPMRSSYGRKNDVLQHEEDRYSHHTHTDTTSFYNGYGTQTIPDIRNPPHHSPLYHEDDPTTIKIGHPGTTLPFQGGNETGIDDFGRGAEDEDMEDEEYYRMMRQNHDGEYYYDDDDRETHTPPGDPPPPGAQFYPPPPQRQHVPHQQHTRGPARHAQQHGVQHWLDDTQQAQQGEYWFNEDGVAEYVHQQHEVKPSMTPTVAKDCPFCGAYVEGDRGALHIYQCKKKHTPKEGKRAFR